MPDDGPPPDLPEPSTRATSTEQTSREQTSTEQTSPEQTSPEQTHTERLWPGPLGWSLVAGCAVAAGIILLPVHPVAAAVGAALALVAAATAAVRWAARVEVRAGELRVGAAHIPVSALGTPVPLDRDGVRRALGPGSDARAFVCVRPWIRGGLQVPVSDPTDPTPSWLLSTRRPRALASAILAAHQAHSEQTS